jgi:endonuclease III
VTKRQVANALVERHGQTYAEQAGIRLKDTPAPLYQLLVLATLLSARISADIATAAARELFTAGFRTPRAMREATWQERVDALGRGHYRRYDERTATMLGDGADVVMDRWSGDLRQLRDAARSTAEILSELQEVPGVGPAGASIFCREAQGVWPELAPFVDAKVAEGAQRVGLPTTPDRLATYVSAADLPRLTAACVRAALSKAVVDDVSG